MIEPVVTSRPQAVPPPDAGHPLEDVIRRYQGGVWRYLCALGCGEELAEELTQETFVIVLGRPFEHRSAAQTAAFLRRTAKHRWLKHRGRRVPRREVSAADLVWEASVRDDDQGWFEATSHCLEQLAPRARQAVVGRWVEERSRHELAERLDLQVEGLKTLLRRAARSLRECIEARIER